MKFQCFLHNFRILTSQIVESRAGKQTAHKKREQHLQNYGEIQQNQTQIQQNPTTKTTKTSIPTCCWFSKPTSHFLLVFETNIPNFVGFCWFLLVFPNQQKPTKTNIKPTSGNVVGFRIQHSKFCRILFDFC